MSFITKWFNQSNGEDYEQILSVLATDIQKRQTKLSELRLRERRSTLLTTLYTLSLWGAYVSLWYMNVIPGFGRQGRGSHLSKALAAAPVLVGPIIVLFIRRVVQIWYKSKGDAEEKTLQELLKQQREKIKEIKRRTNYDSTRNLIERYDDPSGSPLRRRPGPSQPQPLPPSTPVRAPLLSDPNLQTPFVPGGMKSNSSQAFTPMQTIVTPRKHWYDKLADAILGDDDQGGDAAASRYALICEKCFTHNGLVKESMWEDAQYVCPKCNHLNLSARARKQGALSPLPASLYALPSVAMPPSGSKSSSTSPVSASHHLSTSSTSERDSPGKEGDSARDSAGNSSIHMDVDS